MNAGMTVAATAAAAAAVVSFCMPAVQELLLSAGTPVVAELAVVLALG